VLASAFALYRRHFGALILTCAVALAPASLLATGVVAFGLGALGSGGVAEAKTHGEQIQQQQQELQDKPPPKPEVRDERAQQLGREALEGSAGFDMRHAFGKLLPFAYATAMIAAVLLAGLFLAHAATVPLVLAWARGERSGPGHAWAVVGSRFGKLALTGLLGAILVALGALFFVVPGLLLAVGFALAPPLVILQGLSGRAALEESWRLMRGRWGQALLLWALIVVFSLIASAAAVVLHAGRWEPVIATLIRVVLYPLPLAGLVLLYAEATQYIRRSSAPG
jgi:hypothetical protein